MYFNKNLKIKLNDWKNRLYNSNSDNANNNFRFFIEKLKTTPAIESILKIAMDNYSYSTERN